MNVEQIMMRDVPSVHPDTPVGEVARVLLESNVSAVAVTDDDSRFLGFVTEETLVAKHAHVHLPAYFGILGGVIPVGRHHTDEDLKRVLATTARQLIADNMRTVGPDTDVDDAATMIVEEGADPIAVTADGRVVGVVGRREIIRLLVVEEADAGPAAG